MRFVILKPEELSSRVNHGGEGLSLEPLPDPSSFILLPSYFCLPTVLSSRRLAGAPVMNVKKRLLDGARMNRAIRRMAIEVVEKNRGLQDLMIVGIRSRGVPIGERMAKEIEQMEGQAVPFGILDITLYRDDLTTIAPQPVVKPTKLPEPIDDKNIVLVDDVLFTGRTIRAALDALIDFGRPKRVMLAVLIDRGHRELPIHADVIGKTVPTDAHEVIKVKLVETDDEDEVLIMEK